MGYFFVAFAVGLRKMALYIVLNICVFKVESLFIYFLFCVAVVCSSKDLIIKISHSFP